MEEHEEPAAAPAPAASEPRSADEGAPGENVTLPALGESVTEGTVTRWLKAVGDEVAVDEPLLEISTDKVDTEIPSPFAGTLQQILVQEDETVEVGAVLAVIGSGAAPRRRARRGRRLPSPLPPRRRPPSPPLPRRRSRSPRPPPRPSRRRRRPRRSPRPRRPLPPLPLLRPLQRPRRCRAPTSPPSSASSRPRRASTSRRSSAPVSAVASARRTSSTRLPRRRPRRLPPRPRRPSPPLPHRRLRRRRPRPSRRSRRCGAPPRRPAACVRSSPSAWSTPCTRRRS